MAKPSRNENGALALLVSAEKREQETWLRADAERNRASAFSGTEKEALRKEISSTGANPRPNRAQAAQTLAELKSTSERDRRPEKLREKSLANKNPSAHSGLALLER
jgi:hypothetical protein